MMAPLTWDEDRCAVRLLDQTRLPAEEVWLDITRPEQVAEAIGALRIRGAPAIGIAAAYGVALALREEVARPAATAEDAISMLAETRPTAVNLFYSLERMKRVVKRHAAAVQGMLRNALLTEARAIEQEDREAGTKLGEHGLQVLQDGMTVMTHCHAGGVATSGYGTALAPFFMAAERGVTLRAVVGETRPLLQGSSITAWELVRSGIPATLVTDSMAGHMMQQHRIDAVIVGADRIAANGDVANKIGTYGLAVLAHAHGIPLYVSAPMSTVDFSTRSGEAIVIEQRASREITHGFGRATAPTSVQVYNPAFDVTPARLVTAIVTELGVVHPPYGVNLRALASAANR